jgi:hypothetical protein
MSRLGVNSSASETGEERPPRPPSKKFENLKTAVALHFAHYNFVRVHQSLRVTPAMAAGITDHLWSVRDLID